MREKIIGSESSIGCKLSYRLHLSDNLKLSRGQKLFGMSTSANFQSKKHQKELYLYEVDDFYGANYEIMKH